MSRKAVATIDLSAFGHNYRLAKKLAPDSRAMAVIKTNAYGHGAVELARSLADADAFAVAEINEALELRAAGVAQPILLFGGFFERDELPAIIENKLDIVIHTPQQLSDLVNAKLAVPLTVWLKMDSGMHRLGFSPGSFRAVYQQLWASANVASIRLMTHFASADEPDNGYTRSQLDCFKKASKGLAGEISLANSAALTAFPETRADWVRPGIMLYGSNPFVEDHPIADQLQPVMTLSAEIVDIKLLEKGDCVGYGQTWTAQGPARIGVVAIGYGDGYPRHAPSGTPVLVSGQRTSLAGRVSMDFLTVDLTELPEARPGDEVVLWGRAAHGAVLSVNEVAHAAGTISYELFTGINPRVSRVYLGG